jgi:hypothetical protein
MGGDSIAPGQTNVYVLDPPVAAGAWASITLAWERVVEHTGGLTYHYGDMFFPYADPYTRMPDLDLYLVKDTDETIVASSISIAHNEEHIFFRLTGTDRYKILVHHAGGLNNSPGYGLAWWIGDFPTLPGDYNGNGTVGAEDYDTWRSGFGTAITPSTGADGNGNGIIDAADYVVWRNNLIAGSGSTAAVPEPSGLMLLAIVGLCVKCRRRI